MGWTADVGDHDTYAGLACKAIQQAAAGGV